MRPSEPKRRFSFSTGVFLACEFLDGSTRPTRRHTHFTLITRFIVP